MPKVSRAADARAGPEPARQVGPRGRAAGAACLGADRAPAWRCSCGGPIRSPSCWRVMVIGAPPARPRHPDARRRARAAVRQPAAATSGSAPGCAPAPVFTSLALYRPLSPAASSLHAAGRGSRSRPVGAVPDQPQPACGARSAATSPATPPSSGAASSSAAPSDRPLRRSLSSSPISGARRRARSSPTFCCSPACRRSATGGSIRCSGCCRSRPGTSW